MYPANFETILFPLLTAVLLWVGLRKPGRVFRLPIVLAGFTVVLSGIVTAFLSVGTENVILDLWIAIFIGSFVNVIVAIGLALLLSGRRRFYSLVVALGYPLLFVVSSAFGVGQLSPLLIAQEGKLVIEALNRYYAEQGTYPDTLDQLVPDQLPVLNQPKSGWDWRYERTDENFSLAYVMDLYADDQGDRVCVYHSIKPGWNCLPYTWLDPVRPSLLP